ncbi:MAG: hypothetical protein SH850_12865 [Planctomycetaceae bacterium]|nr:hypothetical protein [Planctomycetaceae bacterium]
MTITSLPGSARLKVAVIPLLAVVLIAQMWPRGTDTPLPEVAAVDQGSSPAAVTGNAAAPAHTSEPRHWPKTELAALLQHNPFEVPSALSPPPPEKPVSHNSEAVAQAFAKRQEEQAATSVVQLESKRVSIVLMSPNGATAVVDSKVYRVNDFLEPGVQIAEIRPDAVILHVRAKRDLSADRQQLP